MRPQTGKRPQVASNRLCKPLNGKKQNIRTAAETLPIRGSPSAAIENPMPQGGPVGLFSSSVFSGHGIFEESRNFAFWGDWRGPCGLVRPHYSRLPVARKTGVSRVSVISRQGFDFPDFRCKLYGPFENAPIPQEVKGYADGDSLRQLFSFSGLTFPRTHDIVRLPFREPCMSCVGRPAT